MWQSWSWRTCHDRSQPFAEWVSKSWRRKSRVSCKSCKLNVIDRSSFISSVIDSHRRVATWPLIGIDVASDDWWLATDDRWLLDDGWWQISGIDDHLNSPLQVPHVVWSMHCTCSFLGLLRRFVPTFLLRPYYILLYICFDGAHTLRRNDDSIYIPQSHDEDCLTDCDTCDCPRGPAAQFFRVFALL